MAIKEEIVIFADEAPLTMEHIYSLKTTIMKKTFLWVVMLALTLTGCTTVPNDKVPNFPWMKEVGAKLFPTSERIYNVADYGAIGDAVTLCTKQIQRAIDEAEASGGGIVTFEPGIYLTGSIFLGNNVNLCIPKGTTLIGSQDIRDYQKIPTRVAGIEMEWPAALVNIIGKKNAAITGDGIIHGKGKVFWDKYWEMRKDYTPRGLRWIVDYDCERPRGILICDSEQVTVRDIVLYQPGFWSLHILYSHHVTVDNIIISNNIEGHGPSTDGIDIDSSEYILVQNSLINCNDDNFCLKAGRDADGLRVNRPCQYVVIRDCEAGHGGGMFTCGSETSGGIRHIVAYRMKGVETTCGIRFKSTCQRGGSIEDIHLYDIEMSGVKLPFVVDLNWNPAYSTSLLPEGYDPETIPSHWKTMLLPVSLEKGTPIFRNIHMKRVNATDASSCIQAIGIEQSPLIGFTFDQVKIQGKKAGRIEHVQEWETEGLTIEAEDGKAIL